MACHGTACALTCVGMFVGWLLIASAFLFLTWNRVISELFKMKDVKYWQALLFIATICALCAPRAYYKMRHCGEHGICKKSECAHAVEKK